MLLKAAVEKGGRKGVETASSCCLRRPGKPQAIAVPAPVLLAKGNLPQEVRRRIHILPHDPEPLLAGKGIERIEAPCVFGGGMDVRIVKVAADIIALSPE